MVVAYACFLTGCLSFLKSSIMVGIIGVQVKHYSIYLAVRISIDFWNLYNNLFWIISKFFKVFYLFLLLIPFLYNTPQYLLNLHRFTPWNYSLHYTLYRVNYGWHSLKFGGQNLKFPPITPIIPHYHPNPTSLSPLILPPNLTTVWKVFFGR